MKKYIAYRYLVGELEPHGMNSIRIFKKWNLGLFNLIKFWKTQKIKFWFKEYQL